MNRKQLEVQLSKIVEPFSNPKIEFEQYQTPARVAANLLHISWLRGDIEGRSVIDLCSGTGILAIGAALLGADVTAVEQEDDAFSQLEDNCRKIDVGITLVQEDATTWKGTKNYDTAVLNPPFGIQQRKMRDIEFVINANEIANEVYSIHDGSPTNQENLPKIFKKNEIEIKEAYIDEFPLNKTYPWHKIKKKMYQVLIIHSSKL